MPGRTVLIVLLHGIGDCLMALPAIEALKQQMQKPKITVMTIRQPLYHDLLSYVPSIDYLLFSTLTFNPHYGHPLRFLQEKKIIEQDIQRAVAKHHFTDVYFVKMFRTPAKIYTYLPLQRYRQHKTAIIARELGVKLGKRPRYHLTYDVKARTWASVFLREKKLSQKKLIALHFTGSSPRKSLSFVDGQTIIQQLKMKGYDLLLLHDKNSYAREPMHYDPAVVTTYISDNILKTAALIDQCAAFIGVDSGLAHIAAAEQKKTFVVYFRNVWRSNSLALGDNVYPYTYRRRGEGLLREIRSFLQQ